MKTRRYLIFLWSSVLAGVVVFASIPLVSVAQLPRSVSPVNGSFSFTAINFPGATRTRANGLNDRGEIVGDYIDPSNVRHGYLLHQGSFTNFDPPGSIMTRGLAVNNLGVIGGRFVDSNNVSRSFLLDRGAFTVFDFPGATATILQDLNDKWHRGHCWP